jgi:hypothetical protein
MLFSFVFPRGHVAARAVYLSDRTPRHVKGGGE